uniref:Uncharacterized protein n=1 Tax=Timema bartmani TaxID=61472 RepID=A0A7R9F606_9NEOP|nr:unnamed protein product [Timema bartmani]
MVSAVTMSATDEDVTDKSSILVKEYEEDLSDNLTFEGKRLSTYILPLNFNPRDIQTVARSVEFESALTLYPVSQPALFNHLNAYFSKATARLATWSPRPGRRDQDAATRSRGMLFVVTGHACDLVAAFYDQMLSWHQGVKMCY